MPKPHPQLALQLLPTAQEQDIIGQLGEVVVGFADLEFT